jgi:hypothetical protein
MDRKELENIYKSYGFEVNNSIENIAVFLYKKGRYFGADIIPLNSEEDTRKNAEEIKNTYSELGYAATLRIVNCIEDARVELFKSFFSYDSTIERLKKKYSDFTKKQTQNLLGHAYQYIECPFEIYEEQDVQNNFLSIIKGAVLEEDKPHLIIIEAAAGYGKTSTAFELLNLLISDEQISKIPIITELSRNRGAKIFRYILLDEIDNEFQTLNSELVIKEIKEGRIPVIIDGFDELLSKINLESDIATLEEVEPMLNTIGGLLEDNAKVILTTRKTAIFNGTEFEKWKVRWQGKFEVTRISIKEPRILDWLGDDKVNLLDEQNIQIGAIANPVILAYLKSLTYQEFETQIIDNENLVNQYFKRMLEREKDRQNLFMTVENQYEVFRNVVALLIELDISSESKEFFKEIIKDQNLKLLEIVRTYYPERPTIDSLVDSLATHALLDRKGRNLNQIGFINDFIFGIFIGDIINERPLEEMEKAFSSYMVELGVTAYKVQSSLKRNNLWDHLNVIQHQFTPYTIFNFDIILRRSLVRDYADLDIKELTFHNIEFTEFTIKNTVFTNCVFKNCAFDTEIFEGVSFINCIFEKCMTLDGYLDKYYDGATAINCSEKKCNILIGADSYLQENDITQTEELKTIILNFLWNFEHIKKHHLSSIIKKIEGRSPKKIAVALNELETQKYIIIRGNSLEFNLNKIADIKKILGKG